MEKMKIEKGITLVALVITIILLLILARGNSKYNRRRKHIRQCRKGSGYEQSECYAE